MNFFIYYLSCAFIGAYLTHTASGAIGATAAGWALDYVLVKWVRR